MSITEAWDLLQNVRQWPLWQRNEFVDHLQDAILKRHGKETGREINLYGFLMLVEPEDFEAAFRATGSDVTEVET